MVFFRDHTSSSGKTVFSFPHPVNPPPLRRSALELLRSLRTTFIREAQQSYDQVKDNVLKSAEWMSEEHYSFHPTPTSRSLGRWIGDVAVAQTDTCSAMTGNRVQLHGE